MIKHFICVVVFAKLIHKLTYTFAKTYTFSPKNYQLWYHRRALLEFRFSDTKSDVDTQLGVAKTELDYVDNILGDDSKNYHVRLCCI